MQIHSDWSEVEKELGRLENLPDIKAAAVLDVVLSTAFAATQADTDVITGSLKASGSADSEVSNNEWRGTITYGGLTSGLNNPVRYAMYEQARGGGHDFMRALPEFHEPFAHAVLTALEN